MRRFALPVLAAALLAAPAAHAQARYVRVVSNAESGTVWVADASGAFVQLGMLGAVLPLPEAATTVRLVAPPFALSAPIPTQRDTALVRLDVPVQRTGVTLWQGEPRRYRSNRAWVDAAALGVALVGTAVSIHYKFEADRQFAAYEDTGDPSLRPPIEALDRKAAYAFGTGMLGLGVFTVRLALR